MSLFADEMDQERTSDNLQQHTPGLDASHMNQELSHEKAVTNRRLSGRTRPKSVVNPFSDSNAISGQDEFSEDEWEMDLDSDEKQSTLMALPSMVSTSKRAHRQSRLRYAKNMASDLSDTTITNNTSALKTLQMADPNNLSREKLIELVHELHEKLRIQELSRNTNDALLLSETGPDVIKYKFRHLRNEIQEWSGKYFFDDKFGWIMATSKQFKGLVETPSKYIYDQNRRPDLVEARVWDLLRVNIFETEKNYIFAQSVTRYQRADRRAIQKIMKRRKQKPLEKLLWPVGESKTAESWKRYIEWRASTFNLLCPGSTSDGYPAFMKNEMEARNNRLTRLIWKQLKPFAAKNQKPCAHLEALSDLRKVVTNAMDLDIIIRKQPSEIKVVRMDIGDDGKQFGFPMDEKSMIDTEKKRTSGIVDLVVCPLVWRADTWDPNIPGEVWTVLLEAQVLLQSATKRVHNFTSTEPLHRPRGERRGSFKEGGLKEEDSRREELRRVESRKDVLRRVESRKDELRRVESRKDELRRVESRREELRRVESRRGELSREDPKREEPKRADPGREELRKEESRREDVRNEDSRKEDLRRVKSRREELRRKESRMEDLRKEDPRRED